MSAWIHTEVCGRIGCITLQRPQALNALSLDMVRCLSSTLRQWQDDEHVDAVAIRGANKTGVFGSFCAGGDIRFFHQAALAGDPRLEDFFSEEYALNHLIHTYTKPYLAFMDGIVMGGGMGISQGASHRIVTAHTKMAMPETNIGLFPDVGGGYFLSRCPGRVGEWLALTGELISGPQAIAWGLADHLLDAAQLSAAWDALCSLPQADTVTLKAWIASFSIATLADFTGAQADIDQYFSLQTVPAIIAALEQAQSPWAVHTAATLRKRSPLMLHVVLEHIRRARAMPLPDVLRMERNMVRHCFASHHLGRLGACSETVEGIRALAVDKDHQPRWQPARIEEVSTDMVQPFFQSPWPAHAHPLRDLA